MTQTGLYETLVTKLLKSQLEKQKPQYYVHTQPLDPAEAATYLSRFLGQLLFMALESLPKADSKRVEYQIDLANALVKWLADYLNNAEINEQLIDAQGEILTALFDSTNPVAADLKKHIAHITPKTGLAQSELFTGSNTGLSLESELKREILSSDEICWLVSFIKWGGIRTIKDELEHVARSGTKIRVITTSYMGATDQKAVDFLAGLPNTEVKVSFNTQRERLHAKAYLFRRSSEFHTGYIGSSNLSYSALTRGLEWNIKVTTQEIPHIIEKFQSTFETYWESPEFEIYNAGLQEHKSKLKNALRVGKGYTNQDESSTVFFDLEPHSHQKEILEQLQVERSVHERYKNLVVAATGTGKTFIAAFDFRNFYKANPNARLLFVAHREEILRQARSTFRAVLRQANFGELWFSNHTPEHYLCLFASVATLNNRLEQLQLGRDYFDYIVIDEAHHTVANSYRPIIAYFEPKILLGLTATPERHDIGDITEDFHGRIAAELRLPEAINQGHLCPFQYFGVEDTTDISHVKWVKGRYEVSELTRIYTANDARVKHIMRSMDDLLSNLNEIKALAFCVSKDHARFMAEKFNLNGIRADVLTSDNSEDRVVLRNALVNGKINLLCVVDIFNEGVDIPEVDTVLFLRPTESLTVFLQQLGRGLRLSDGKECLTVLDFVGNAHVEYDFAQKFRALIGKTHTSVADEVENDFPHLPLGCSIILQRQAKETILANIRNAVAGRRKLISWIRSFHSNTDTPLTLKNFLNHYPQLSIEDIYKVKIGVGGGWSRLQIEAGQLVDDIDFDLEKVIYSCISKRLTQNTSLFYLRFVQKLFETKTWDQNDVLEQQLALMVLHDFWREKGSKLGFTNLNEALQGLTKDAKLNAECVAVVDQLINRINIKELPMLLDFPTALRLHSRYSRDQILAAFGVHRFDHRASSREGVLFIPELNCELLFVTLQKTEAKFSPTTLYHDYAISEHLFHWQSQNSARPDRGRGLSYIQHRETGKKIILFVRERNTDEHGRTMGFINLGLVHFQSSNGTQPMNITWRLATPLPSWLWKEAAKLAVG